MDQGCEFKTLGLKFEFDEMEEKADDPLPDGVIGTFSGFGNVTGYKDSYGDIVDPGAFLQTIKQNNGKFTLLRGHEVNEIAGMAEVDELLSGSGKKGLRVTRGLLFDTEVGRDTYTNIKMFRSLGKKPEMSIGWRPVDGKWYYDSKKEARVLTEVKLFHIGILPPNHAANSRSTIDRVKADHDLLNRIADLENQLKELTEKVNGLALPEGSAIVEAVGNLSADIKAGSVESTSILDELRKVQRELQ